jgi:hypothetical protein
MTLTRFGAILPEKFTRIPAAGGVIIRAVPPIRTQRCWVVDCKTPDCGVLVLAIIGENHPSKIHFLKRCRDFRETCEVCRAEHLYTRADVREED